MNKLYLGDCLNVLRENIPDESVDLIYIDPPFNSKRDYNIFFDDKEIQSQRIAFEDTWTLKNIQDSLQELHTMKTEHLYYLLLTYQKVAPHAFPYLTMMALRLAELHRVLKPTGSFYLHCDPTMSHYLKTVCDVVFGASNYRSEIIWKRQSAHNDARNKFGTVSDILLFYVKTEKAIFNVVRMPLDENYVAKFYRHKDIDGRLYRISDLRSPNPRPNLMYSYKGYKPHPNGWAVSKERMKELDEQNRLFFPAKQDGRIQLKRYLDENEGAVVSNIWSDILPLHGSTSESLGYPTQKPKALLERIIKASSNEGDVVLDAFCGCGTTIDAAEGLHRNWIGIDVSPVAVSLIKRRLREAYKKGLSEFEVRGIPTDEQSALNLAKENPFAFQDWWISEFEVFSSTYGTKGADKGVDGIGLYALDNKGATLRVAFQVKGGENVQSKDIDALIGAMSKHKCELGVFLTAAKPTKPMLETTAGAGFVSAPGFEFPKLQILTLSDYFSGKRPKLPSANITFKAAQHTGKKSRGQLGLL
jgi:site-specific DNA-methyltransferase (adenine-specific)